MTGMVYTYLHTCVEVCVTNINIVQITSLNIKNKTCALNEVFLHSTNQTADACTHIIHVRSRCECTHIHTLMYTSMNVDMTLFFFFFDTVKEFRRIWFLS